jgi:hypothetical protein
MVYNTMLAKPKNYLANLKSILLKPNWERNYYNKNIKQKIELKMFTYHTQINK